MQVRWGSCTSLLFMHPISCPTNSSFFPNTFTTLFFVQSFSFLFRLKRLFFTHISSKNLFFFTWISLISSKNQFLTIGYLLSKSVLVLFLSKNQFLSFRCLLLHLKNEFFLLRYLLFRLKVGYFHLCISYFIEKSILFTRVSLLSSKNQFFSLGYVFFHLKISSFHSNISSLL